MWECVSSSKITSNEGLTWTFSDLHAFRIPPSRKFGLPWSNWSWSQILLLWTQPSLGSFEGCESENKCHPWRRIHLLLLLLLRQSLCIPPLHQFIHLLPLLTTQLGSYFCCSLGINCQPCWWPPLFFHALLDLGPNSVTMQLLHPISKSVRPSKLAAFINLLPIPFLAQVWSSWLCVIIEPVFAFLEVRVIRDKNARC